MLKFLPVILLTFLGAVGSYNFKLATLHSEKILKIMFRKELYIGGFFYLASIVLYIYSLKSFALSVLLPETSLTYVWSMVLSFVFLKEKMSRNKLIGAGLIMLGFIIVSSAAL